MVKRKLPTKNSKPLDVNAIVSEMENIKAQKKLLETREKELKDKLKAIVQEKGAKDQNGSFKLVVGDKLAQCQARKTIKLNQTVAREVLEAKGLWDEVKEVKESVNEDLLAQLYTQEKISSEELEGMTDTKIVYAMVISDYKEEDEEEMPLID